MKKKSKNVAVLFSSGLDSTYLVLKNLKEGNKVYPYYVEIKNNESKVIVEKQNIFKLYKEMNNDFAELIAYPRILSEVEIPHNKHNLHFTQLPIWIFSLAYIDTHGIDEIQIGYVSNDDAISYLKDIKKTYKAQSWYHKEKQPKLKFPLIKHVKYMMVKDIPTKYRNYMSSCENPTLKPYSIKNPNVEFMSAEPKKFQIYEPCGECVPCLRLIREEVAYNDLYQKLIEKKYERNRLMDYMENFLLIMPEEYKEIISKMEEMKRNHYSKQYESLAPIEKESQDSEVESVMGS